MVASGNSLDMVKKRCFEQSAAKTLSLYQIWVKFIDYRKGNEPSRVGFGYDPKREGYFGIKNLYYHKH